MRIAVVSLAAALVVVAGAAGGSKPPPPDATPETSPVGTWTPASPTSAVALARTRSVASYARPGAPHPALRLANPNPERAPLTLLVKAWRLGWLRVFLPVRPDGRTGWIRTSSVSLARDDYRVFVELRRHRITVLRRTAVVDREPVGVGRAVTPTPTGVYYITELLRQSDPNGFSNALFHFGGGPGEIGLHGTNFPQGLGRDVSHGCIRMSNRGITLLAHLLPLGTPVVISR